MGHLAGWFRTMRRAITRRRTSVPAWDSAWQGRATPCLAAIGRMPATRQRQPAWNLRFPPAPDGRPGAPEDASGKPPLPPAGAFGCPVTSFAAACEGKEFSIAGFGTSFLGSRFGVQCAGRRAPGSPETSPPAAPRAAGLRRAAGESPRSPFGRHRLPRRRRDDKKTLAKR